MVKEPGFDHPVADAKIAFKVAGQSKPAGSGEIEARPVKNCRKAGTCEITDEAGDVVSSQNCFKDACPTPNADGYFGAMVAAKVAGLSFSNDFLGVEGVRASELTSVRHFTKTEGFPANNPIRTEMAGETTSFYDVGVMTARYGADRSMSVDQLRQLEANIIGCDDPDSPDEAVFQFPLMDVTIHYATNSGEMPTEMDGDYNPYLLCPGGPFDPNCELRHVKREGVYLKGIAALGDETNPTRLLGDQRTVLCATLNLIEGPESDLTGGRQAYRDILFPGGSHSGGGDCPDLIENLMVEVYLDPADRDENSRCKASYFKLSSDAFPPEVVLPKLKFGTQAIYDQGDGGPPVDVGNGSPFFVTGGMGNGMYDIIDTWNIGGGFKFFKLNLLGFAITNLGKTEPPSGRRRRRLKLAEAMMLARSSDGSGFGSSIEARMNRTSDGQPSRRVVVDPHARRYLEEEEEIPFTYGEAVFDAEFLETASVTRVSSWTTLEKTEYGFVNPGGETAIRADVAYLK